MLMLVRRKHFDKIGSNLVSTHRRFQWYPILPAPIFLWLWKWPSKLKSHFFRGSFSRLTFQVRRGPCLGDSGVQKCSKLFQNFSYPLFTFFCNWFGFFQSAHLCIHLSHYHIGRWAIFTCSDSLVRWPFWLISTFSNFAPPPNELPYSPKNMGWKQ